MWVSSETSADQYVRPKSTDPKPGHSLLWLRNIVRAGDDDSTSVLERSMRRWRPRLMFTDERQLLEITLGINFS